VPNPPQPDIASPSPSLRATLLWLRLAAAALAGVGCQQQENVILLEVRSPEAVGDLTISVIPLDGTAAADTTTRQVNQTAAEIRATPLRVAIRLEAPRDVMVVLRADGGALPLVAQRCISVLGVARDDVWLVPLGQTEDMDEDGFPRRAVATCARPSADGTMPVPCANDDPFLCSEMGETDCDDDDPRRFPGATDMCGNGLDENCDGADVACEDADGDMFAGCRAGDARATCDCNDRDPDTFPGASDPCGDATDQDCDGSNDLCDVDCDGYPEARMGDTAAYVDCNDALPAVHPNEPLRGIYGLADGDRRARGCEANPMTGSASDLCTAGPMGEPTGDSIDQDCNGFIDDGPGCTDTTDRDRDGARACASGMTTGCDLDDCDPGVAPSRDEICGNDIDEDGDGMSQPCALNDTDRDGHVANTMGGDDCNDGDPEVYFGAPEDCRTEESESCTENIPCMAFGGDADGDGYLTGLPAGVVGDCDDADAEVRPFASEDPCDGIDNDCDGVTDEVLRAPDARPDTPDGCVRTGGGATPVDYHLSTPYSEYCGGCGVTTELNEDCCAGVPTSIDLPSSCGDCGYDCGPHTDCPMTGTGTTGNAYTCACAPDASGEWADCDGSLLGGSGGDGCETNLDTDELHCGACDVRCGSNQVCNGGRCECVAPYLDCDGSRATGCEINGSTDVANCNTCGNRCAFSSGSPACVAGECRLAGCDPGFDDCNRAPVDGCETPLDTLMDCGRCGETCAGTVNASETCSTPALRCDYMSCDMGFLNCDMNRVNGCETGFSTANCGACGTRCGSNEGCNAAGDCQCGAGASAPSGEACTGATPDCCGSACTDLQSDAANCGACGNRCGPGETCAAGRCTCGGARGAVGSGEACVGGTPDCCGTTCVNVANNTTNCGACGNVCGANETCSSGQCTCGGARGVTGAGEACSGTGNECCGSTCTDVRSAVSSCGGCGTNCASTVLNAVETCSMSMCGYSSCDPGFGDCVGGMPNGCETNLLTSLTACGSCTTNCNTTLLNTMPAGRSCASGICSYGSCAAGFGDCDANPANGCELPVNTVMQCGSCGNNCMSVVQNATPACSGGTACDYSGACSSGFGDCYSNRGNGCEAPTNTATRCGSCGNNCASVIQNATAICSGGTTCDYTGMCSSGFGDCDANRGNGCEASTTSPMRCGSCGNNCASVIQNATAICSGGTNCDYSSCSSGFGDCDSNRGNGCEASTTSPMRCGSCGNNCTAVVQNATAICSGGTNCDYSSCSSGFDDCDSNRGNGCEASTRTTARCGDCTSMCGTNETCNGSGDCQCGTALTASTGPVCSGGMVCNPAAMGGMGQCVMM
jgi:hypothetical protein